MLTVTLIRSARVSVFGEVLSPTRKTVSIAPHVLFNGLLASQLGRVERGSSLYAELAAFLDNGTLKVTADDDAGTVITTSAGLATYLQASGGVQPIALTGYLEVDVTGGGTIELTAAQLAANIIEFTGALAADAFVTVLLVEGNQRIFRNSTTGNFNFQLLRGAGSHYLGRRQQKQFYVDSGPNLRAVDPYSYVSRGEVSLAGIVGSHDSVLEAVPPSLQITRANMLTTRATNLGATSTIRLGLTVGGEELAQATAAGAAGTVIGDDPATLGTALTNGGSCDIAPREIHFRNDVSGVAANNGLTEYEVLGILKGFVQ